MYTNNDVKYIEVSIMEHNKRDIYDRIFNLIIRVLDYVRKLPNRLEINIIAKQLIRSITSIGANSQEADGSESKAEFIHRFSIAKKRSKRIEILVQNLKRSDRHS